jgi:uncharacterized protein YqjF (DUF2071 family)
MEQKWHDLLFAHWSAPADALRRLIPEKCELDTFDGQAWISVVPFTMSGVRLRGTPAIPWLSAFPELNVRTYVSAGGKPGVWFFSLDAANPVAVEIARCWFHLPYFYSRMKSTAALEGIVYSAQRRDRRGRNERLEATYSARGTSFEAQPGTLEYFLAERYCLYAQKPDGTLLRGEIHHAPWRLQEARASFTANTMVENLGIVISGPPGVLQFSKLQDVIVWRPREV